MVCMTCQRRVCVSAKVHTCTIRFMFVKLNKEYRGSKFVEEFFSFLLSVEERAFCSGCVLAYNERCSYAVHELRRKLAN